MDGFSFSLYVRYTSPLIILLSILPFPSGSARTWGGQELSVSIILSASAYVFSIEQPKTSHQSRIEATVSIRSLIAPLLRILHFAAMVSMLTFNHISPHNYASDFDSTAAPRHSNAVSFVGFILDFFLYALRQFNHNNYIQPRLL